MNRRIIAAGALSLLVYFAIRLFVHQGSLDYSPQMLGAAARMEEAISVIREHLDTTGHEIDKGLDPNRTGLIGPDFTSLTTTLGDLEAKRTTTNPGMAALIVHLLSEAGVTAGDTVAVGCSASFPALMIASLAAVEAMGVHPVTIISLGASSYGATDDEFNLLDIYLVLRKEGVLGVPIAAVSLGGKRDAGEDFEPETREKLFRQIEESGIPLIHEPDLRMNVEKRMGVYLGGGAAGGIAAFINVGGSDANIGTSPQVLRLSPGLNLDPPIPPEDEQGMIFEFAARGVPVIHLLYIKGLALKYGLPWDPVPLPESGSTQLSVADTGFDPVLLLVSVAYFAGLLMLVFWKREGYTADSPQSRRGANSGQRNPERN